MEQVIERVEAEVVGEAASPQDILRFDAEGVIEDLVGMQKALDHAAQKAELYDVGEEAVRAEELKQLRAYRADINATVKEYDEARKSLKRRLMAPYEEAERRGAEVIKPLKAIEQRFKREVDTRDARERQEREDHLREVYETAAPALVPVVPFERVLEANADKKWLLKSTKVEKAEDQLLKAVDNIANGWEQLRGFDGLHYPEEAEAEYFRTLDLGAVLQHDRERWDEQQRIEAMRAEVDANKAAIEPDYTYAATDHDGGAAVVAEVHHETLVPEPDGDGGEVRVYDVVNEESELSGVYLLACEATPSQVECLRQYLRMAGVSGVVLPRPDLDMDSARMVIRNVR